MQIDRDLVYRLVGHKVRDLRTMRGMTQASLAKRIRAARTTITNLEMGNQAVPLHQMFAIAAALETEVAELLPTQSEIVAAEPQTFLISGIPAPAPPQTAILISTIMSEPREEDHG